MKTVLTIAGSDSSGGAGIQADLKTFTMHNTFGMSVITAITAQNTTRVRSIQNINKEMIEDQMDAVFEDIYPGAVKIGMVSNTEIIKVIARKLRKYNAKNIVLDTVMVSTSGHTLLEKEARETLVEELLPLALIITPNLPEAEILCGFEINNEEEMRRACKKISTYYKGYILIKGGHLETGEKATDILYKDGKYEAFENDFIDNKNTHGTGCTLSSAIAANLALGKDIEESVKLAKEYVYSAISSKIDLGKGKGPIDHMHKFNLGGKN
ncbi:bifunctional hydroxymethylpyrimidine kinase/phosphomethylpyrimidine kinase [Psychrilyobacter sp.]|uniref:bifunctional hydroxymethylpyrimidine kinase/phosphomethylpyrimidine kinase n=1 Tax=Psychrilyobacter sp. TaxID=2586924 RepID=UPI0030175616